MMSNTDQYGTLMSETDVRLMITRCDIGRSHGSVRFNMTIVQVVLSV